MRKVSHERPTEASGRPDARFGCVGRVCQIGSDDGILGECSLARISWRTWCWRSAARLFVGNLLAVIKPPERQLDETNLERAPVVRSLAFALLGFVAAVWALASLVSG